MLRVTAKQPYAFGIDATGPLCRLIPRTANKGSAGLDGRRPGVSPWLCAAPCFAPESFIQVRSVSRDQYSPHRISRPFRPPFGVLCTFPLRYLYAIGNLFRDLALEEYYLPSSDCTFKQTYSIPPQPQLPHHRLRGFNALWRRGSNGFASGAVCLNQGDQPHIARPPVKAVGFRDGLCRVHSQLLTASLLISFGSPYLYA